MLAPAIMGLHSYATSEVNTQFAQHLMPRAYAIVKEIRACL